MGFADHSWAKTFASIDPAYREMTVNDIIDQVFSTTNPDDLETYLETVKNMFSSKLAKPDNMKKFINLCASFGINPENLI